MWVSRRDGADSSVQGHLIAAADGQAMDAVAAAAQIGQPEAGEAEQTPGVEQH